MRFVTNAMISPMRIPSSASAPSRIIRLARGQTTAGANGTRASELDRSGNGTRGGEGGGFVELAALSGPDVAGGGSGTAIVGGSGAEPTGGTPGTSATPLPVPTNPALTLGSAGT